MSLFDNQRQTAARRLQLGVRRALALRRSLPRAALAAAEELAAARRMLGASFGELAACARCVTTCRGRRRLSGRHGLRPAPPPTAWRGGRCCEAATDQLFDEVELLLLALAGVPPAMLAAAPHATPANGARGCAFRLLTGCALPADVRPTVCVGYICRELAAELDDRAALRRIARQIARMEDLRERFVAIVFDRTVSPPRPISGLAELDTRITEP